RTLTVSVATNITGAARTGTAQFLLKNEAQFINDGTLTQEDQVGFFMGAAPDDTSVVKVINNGTWDGSVGSRISVPFDNNGKVQLQANRLDLWGGGTSNGTFTGQDGSLLWFSGNHTLTGDISTKGHVSFSYGTTSVAGSYFAAEATDVGFESSVDFSGAVSGV